MLNGSTVVKSCTCHSPYQDRKYGTGNRVMNIGGSKDTKTKCCTVCGTKHRQSLITGKTVMKKKMSPEEYRRRKTDKVPKPLHPTFFDNTDNRAIRRGHGSKSH